MRAVKQDVQFGVRFGAPLPWLFLFLSPLDSPRGELTLDLSTTTCTLSQLVRYVFIPPLSFSFLLSQLFPPVPSAPPHYHQAGLGYPSPNPSPVSPSCECLAGGAACLPVCA